MKKQGHKKQQTSNIYQIDSHIEFVHALCLITVKPGKVDTVVEILKKKRKVVKQVMVVTGRADISVILQGKIEIPNLTNNIDSLLILVHFL